MPGLDYKQSFTIESIEGAGDTIKVYLSSPLSKLPLISSTVILPNSEAD